MRNRAKCKLCESIIESLHATDYAYCRCKAIAVFEGDAMRCSASNWDNFLRVDDDGNEIVVKVKEKEDVNPLYIETKPTKKELLDMLDEMIKSYDNLPGNAMLTPVTHYDLASSLLLLSSILRAG